MRGTESIKAFANAAAATVTFTLNGGRYSIAFNGTGAGTVDVSMLGPDGSTYQTVGVTQIVATTGHQIVELPPGSYRAVIAGFTANYLTLTRVPSE